MYILEIIRKSRIFSYVMSGFAVYWLSDLLSWIYSQNVNNLTPEATALMLGMLTALVGLVKITYTFASHSPPSDKNN